MSPMRLAAWRMIVCAVMASLVLAPVVSAQIIIVPGPAIRGQLVDVVISEGSIRMPGLVKRGWVTFRVTNAGREYHSFTVGGEGKTYSLPVAVPPGYAAFLPVKIHEGVHTVWCPMEGHADNGEQVTLVVYH